MRWLAGRQGKFGLFLICCLVYLAITELASVPTLENESEAYLGYGQNLLHTHTYGVVPGVSDDYREPGYGIFLALANSPLFVAEKIFGLSLDQSQQLHWLIFIQAAFFLVALGFFLAYSELPEPVKGAFVFLALLSPTLWGANAVIYSETVAISIAILLMTIFSRSDLFRRRQLILAGLLCGFLLMTKMYLMFLPPMAILAIAGLQAIHFKRTGMVNWRNSRLLIVPLIALLFFAAWKTRSQFIEKREADNTRIILQLGGKVYRHKIWNLPEEWKPALLASCCSATCARKYGTGICDKYNFRRSDDIGYEVLAEWRQRPAAERKGSLVRSVLMYWWSTLPIQIVGSGLEFLRMAFFEGATVTSSSPELWKKIAQLWHFFGSLLMWALAFFGFSRIWRVHAPVIRQVVLLAVVFLVNHILLMSQVTNVQRYFCTVLPWIYLLAAFAVIGKRRATIR